MPLIEMKQKHVDYLQLEIFKKLNSFQKMAIDIWPIILVLLESKKHIVTFHMKMISPRKYPYQISPCRD
ncbi:hypothetical protein H5410_008363 [Solanum commersonii]|uniref:Uncharacterized protein n=1 Tax=Solanum commersonii TaxID=4109 RepID=A0A9J6AFF9_SOLCO|nr:hypothetical protein H5410_008363 [Solanum commersonii]